MVEEEANKEAEHRGWQFPIASFSSSRGIISSSPPHINPFPSLRQFEGSSFLPSGGHHSPPPQISASDSMSNCHQQPLGDSHDAEERSIFRGYLSGSHPPSLPSSRALSSPSDTSYRGEILPLLHCTARHGDERLPTTAKLDSGGARDHEPPSQMQRTTYSQAWEAGSIDRERWGEERREEGLEAEWEGATGERGKDGGGTDERNPSIFSLWNPPRNPSPPPASPSSAIEMPGLASYAQHHPHREHFPSSATPFPPSSSFSFFTSPGHTAVPGSLSYVPSFSLWTAPPVGPCGGGYAEEEGPGERQPPQPHLSYSSTRKDEDVEGGGTLVQGFPNAPFSAAAPCVQGTLSISCFSPLRMSYALSTDEVSGVGHHVSVNESGNGGVKARDDAEGFEEPQ